MFEALGIILLVLIASAIIFYLAFFVPSVIQIVENFGVICVLNSRLDKIEYKGIDIVGDFEFCLDGIFRIKYSTDYDLVIKDCVNNKASVFRSCEQFCIIHIDSFFVRWYLSPIINHLENKAFYGI